jgi:small subunit ribosomal protein S17
MADQPDDPTQDTPEPDAPDQQEAEASAGETQAGSPAAETSDEQAPEAGADGGEPDAAAPPDAPAPGAEPEEQLPPKERRRRARSKHSGTARPARSPEERRAEALEERRRKAVRRRARRQSERAKAAERRASRPPAEPLAPVHAPVQGSRRVRQGVVVSDKAAKTITVRIDVARRHRRYEKIVRSSNTVHAHDESNDANVGDVVRVIESRPLSRTKRWTLVDVVERAR